MPDLLLEIGLEEVPARMIAAAQAELLKRTLALLAREQLVGADPVAKSYSTPRRLAVLVENVRAQQSDLTEEVTGPAVKIAFKDGKPTPAAEAFARKSGVAVADLKTITTPKGEYLAASIVKKGRSAAEVLASELPKEIAALYWAKNMRWIPGSNERFVRPVLWLVCLLDEEIVPISFGGKTAGRDTYGHRVLCGYAPMYITSASTWIEPIQNIPVTYTGLLENMYVLVDVETRRQKIRKALDHVTRTVPGARWREDEALVDTVTHLTEWPDVLLGSFEREYLELPEEVLVTVMRDHQKYFAVEDGNGKLAPYFLTVTNIALDAENTATIRQGNERVLRARFNDARFFWEFDQRTSLLDRQEMLKSVTFQRDVGSYFDKSDSVLRISRALYTRAVMNGMTHVGTEQNGLEMAARLAKTDLTTELVKEFTDLEGKIGGLYAKKANLGEVVSTCIYWQYEPKNAASPIPPTAPAQILGLADRMNTIVDMIALGNLPSGSKDPLALRRSANGVIKILAESQLPLTVSDLYEAAKVESKFAKTTETEDSCRKFLLERVEFYLKESKGQAYDVVKAVMAAGSEDIRDLVARAQAVTAVRGSTDFLAVCAGFKRMKNILAQAGKQELVETPAVVTVHVAEQALQSASIKVNEQFAPLTANHQYVDALEILATLRPPIDRFFEEVMVMDPDPYVRYVRLGILESLVSTFSTIADFSEIVTAT